MSKPASPARVTTTLVIGPGAGAREQAIFAQLHRDGAGIDASISTGILLEGLASGNSPLHQLPANIQLARIAPGCLCCTGNLVLRVTLNRMLRQRPVRLFIGVAGSEHLDQLRSWLQAEPYDQLLMLTPDLQS